jgi:hypothetical protein
MRKTKQEKVSQGRSPRLVEARPLMRAPSQGSQLFRPPNLNKSQPNHEARKRLAVLAAPVRRERRPPTQSVTLLSPVHAYSSSRSLLELIAAQLVDPHRTLPAGISGRGTHTNTAASVACFLAKLMCTSRRFHSMIEKLDLWDSLVCFAFGEGAVCSLSGCVAVPPRSKRMHYATFLALTSDVRDKPVSPSLCSANAYAPSGRFLHASLRSSAHRTFSHTIALAPTQSLFLANLMIRRDAPADRCQTVLLSREPDTYRAGARLITAMERSRVAIWRGHLRIVDSSGDTFELSHANARSLRGGHLSVQEFVRLSEQGPRIVEVRAPAGQPFITVQGILDALTQLEAGWSALSNQPTELLHRLSQLPSSAGCGHSTREPQPASFAPEWRTLNKIEIQLQRGYT